MLSRQLLPTDLWLEYCRDINEAFYDLYAESRAAAGRTAPARLLGRELACLIRTAIDERRAAGRRRQVPTALRARPRTTNVPSPPRPDSPSAPSSMLESLLHDVRFALRTLRQSPVFTTVAIATLGVGIGANAAVFSVVNTVLLQPLPYDEPEGLFVVWTDFGRDLPQNWISGPEHLEIRDLNNSFDEFAVFTTATWSMTAGGDEPAQVEGAAVSGEFFEVLRTQAAQGRLLVPADDSDDRKVVGVSDAFWHGRLGGRPDILGAVLTLDDDSFEVVGVLPADFRIHHPNVVVPERLGLFAPFQPAFQVRYDEMSRGSHFLLGLGRARNGVTLEQAQTDLDTVAVRMNELTGSYDFEGWGLSVYSLQGDLVEDVAGALVILLGAVGFVLLIACVNVANLQLARAAHRGREMALRAALGAGRGRLVRQLLTEAVVLGTAGAVAGVALTFWLVVALHRIVPEGLPRAASISIDGTVLAFAAAAAVLTVLLFGVVPGLAATRADLAGTLKDGARTASTGRGGRLRRTLVMAEVAVALVLLVGAGLMLRSFDGLLHTDPGYRTESVLTLRVDLPRPQYDIDTANQFHRQLLDRVRTLPGVLGAGSINSLPLSNTGSSGTTLAEHSDSESVDAWGGIPFIEADRRSVSPGYFEAMDVELLAGRLFNAGDAADSQPVAVVDETFARRFWGAADPVGERISVNFGADSDGHGPADIVWSEVVGVVRHARTRDLASDGREQVYVPAPQRPAFGMHLAVRTDGEPGAVAAAVRSTVWDIDPDQPVSDVATMHERVANAVAPLKFMSLLLGSFAGIAALLAALGIYGVVSLSVGQRTGEIGIRMALGASRSGVRGMVLREGMLMAAAGALFGGATAFGLTRVIAGLLYQVSPTDPITFVAVTVLLLLVAVGACLVPATRATRVEPVTALRQE